MANFVYTKAKVDFAKAAINLATDTLKFALLTSSYTPNQDTDDVWATISGNEVSGTGYTAGGVTLASQAVAADNANHRMKFTAANPSWTSATITARYGVIYDPSATTANRLIALYDFGSNQTSTAGTFTVTFDATNGALTLT